MPPDDAELSATHDLVAEVLDIATIVQCGADLLAQHWPDATPEARQVMEVLLRSARRLRTTVSLIAGELDRE